MLSSPVVKDTMACTNGGNSPLVVPAEVTELLLVLLVLFCQEVISHLEANESS